MLVIHTEHGLALKPEVRKGWKSYNFEVEELHTNIAGGVWVHNIFTAWAHDTIALDIA